MNTRRESHAIFSIIYFIKAHYKKKYFFFGNKKNKLFEEEAEKYLKCSQKKSTNINGLCTQSGKGSLFIMSRQRQQAPEAVSEILFVSVFFFLFLFLLVLQQHEEPQLLSCFKCWP